MVNVSHKIRFKPGCQRKVAGQHFSLMLPATSLRVFVVYLCVQVYVYAYLAHMHAHFFGGISEWAFLSIFRTERFPRTYVGRFCFLESISKVANVCWRVDAINGRIFQLNIATSISSIFLYSLPPSPLSSLLICPFSLGAPVLFLSFRTLPIFVCHARVSRLQLIKQKNGEIRYVGNHTNNNT